MTETDRPLVTFALFAYNQEKYIREAVEGAFSQTYQPLEIILSDDCSSDRTFEIIQEMAAAYEGPHKVIFNKTPENLCTLGHFFNVVEKISGTVILLAAGDDISKESRTEVTMKEWRETKFLGACTHYDLINDDGDVVKESFLPASLSKVASEVFDKNEAFDIHGASSAYDVSFIRSIPRVNGRFFFEDSYMTYMVYLCGGEVKVIDKSLVLYRTHDESISNNYFKKRIFSEELEAQISASTYSENKHQLYVSILKTLECYPNGREWHYKDYIRKTEIYASAFKVRGEWYNYNFFKKLEIIFSSRDTGFNKWALPRLLGLNFFVLLKVLPSYFNKKT